MLNPLFIFPTICAAVCIHFSFRFATTYAFFCSATTLYFFQGHPAFSPSLWLLSTLFSLSLSFPSLMLFLFQKFKQRSTVKRTTKNKNWWDASFHSSEPLLLCCSAIISYFIFYPIIMPKLISMAAATKTATLSKIMFGMILGLGYFTAFYTLPQNIQAQPNSTRIVLKLILFGSLSGLLCFLFPTDLLGYAAMQHKQHRSKKLHKSIKKVLPFLQVTCGLLCVFSYC